MSRPGFGESVALALLGALATPVLAQGLIWLMPPHEQARWLCLLLGLGYGLYLLARSPSLARSLRRLGAMALMPPICMPMEPKFANPQRA